MPILRWSDGANGRPFAFCYTLAIDSIGVLPDGRSFSIQDIKNSWMTDKRLRVSDRVQIDQTANVAKANHYRLRETFISSLERSLLR